ncbi:MFS transporter [Pseudochelatococcus lubricantis]|uniref:MFS transporter n=1 Tax=Pseudochelatococcus lubricantis TaxID=1538102 RepID=UPI0035EBC97E
MRRLANFTVGPYRRYLGALLCAQLGVQIQTVAVGWQVYSSSGNAFHLALIGLTQFLPALVLVIGQIVDRCDRRNVLTASILGMAAMALVLSWTTSRQTLMILPILILFFGAGIGRAFYNASRQAILARIVPEEALPQAVSMNSMANQMAIIIGPILGGVLSAHANALPHLVAFGLHALALICVAGIPSTPPDPFAAKEDGSRTEMLLGGFNYLRGQPILLGSMLLDMLVVLFGSVVGLLPVYANDILKVGPEGLGVLRASLAAGSIIAAFWIVRRPLDGAIGQKLFLFVMLFGASSIVFSVSTSMILSMLCLFLAGMFDMVGLSIRQSLLQLNTDDHMRGRVQAINLVFVGASNEIGAFRAGSAAVLLGPVAALVTGGLMSIGVAGVMMRAFPSLFRINNLKYRI